LVEIDRWERRRRRKPKRIKGTTDGDSVVENVNVY
jgi:hypothetical protein